MSLPKSILSLCCLVLLSACSEPDSPEAQVRKAIDAMETAAEARDTSDVMEFVATDFRDAYGQGAAELETYLRGYFIANQSLHLLTRINRIDFPTADEARLNVSVGMVSRDAEASGSWNTSAEIHDFAVTMRKEGHEWKVTYAKLEGT